MSAIPLKCLETVLNTAEYPSWNTSWPRVTITHLPSPEGVNLEAAELQRVVGLPGYLYAGIKMTSEVHKTPGDGSPTMAKLEVSVMEKFEKAGRTGYRVAWKGVGIPFFLFHMERVQEFVETEIEGKVVTEYYCWETFGGLLSYAVRWLMGKQLEAGFMRILGQLPAQTSPFRQPRYPGDLKWLQSTKNEGSMTHLSSRIPYLIGPLIGFLDWKALRTTHSIGFAYKGTKKKADDVSDEQVLDHSQDCTGPNEEQSADGGKEMTGCTGNMTLLKSARPNSLAKDGTLPSG
ncbi:hypothetical protein AUP68_10138 [Ilyonectria robusta]